MPTPVPSTLSSATARPSLLPSVSFYSCLFSFSLMNLIQLGNAPATEMASVRCRMCGRSEHAAPVCPPPKIRPSPRRWSVFLVSCKDSRLPESAARPHCAQGKVTLKPPLIYSPHSGAPIERMRCVKSSPLRATGEKKKKITRPHFVGGFFKLASSKDQSSLFGSAIT